MKVQGRIKLTRLQSELLTFAEDAGRYKTRDDNISIIDNVAQSLRNAAVHVDYALSLIKGKQ